jgi:tetratricopeptide (TPR) repeat protein
MRYTLVGGPASIRGLSNPGTRVPSPATAPLSVRGRRQAAPAGAPNTAPGPEDPQSEQGQADCVHSYQQAADLVRRIDDRPQQAVLAFNLGNAYLTIPALRDLDRAEQHYWESLALHAEHDQFGRARVTGSLGAIAHGRFNDARTGGAPATVLAGHLNTAADRYQQALAILPADAVPDRATLHNQLGTIYGDAGQADTALTHFQKSIKFSEAAGDRYTAGATRHNIARLLHIAGRHSDALAYARAALADFASYGPAAAKTVQARQVVAGLEQVVADQQP